MTARDRCPLAGADARAAVRAMRELFRSLGASVEFAGFALRLLQRTASCSCGSPRCPCVGADAAADLSLDAIRAIDDALKALAQMRDSLNSTRLEDATDVERLLESMRDPDGGTV